MAVAGLIMLHPLYAVRTERHRRSASPLKVASMHRHRAACSANPTDA